MSDPSPFRWRSNGIALRLGLSLLVLILLGGLAVSALHMAHHYDNRDGKAGLTLDDVKGAYHGVHKPAAMREILQNGHSDSAADASLTEQEQQVLIAWLESDRISEDYDNLDLGDAAPAEIIAIHCLDCHSRQSDVEIGETVPLDDWSEVKKSAFAQQVEPTSQEIVIASLHTHSISLATLAIVTIILLLGTAWPRWVVGLLSFGSGLGLAADLGSWLLARHNDMFIYGIVIGGAVFAGANALSLLAVLADLWRPCRDAGQAANR